MSESDLVLIKGYDHCVVGVCNRMHQETIIAYDMQKFLETTMKMHGFCENAAMQYIEEVILGEWSGEATPCFISATGLDSIKEHYSEIADPNGTTH